MLIIKGVVVNPKAWNARGSPACVKRGLRNRVVESCMKEIAEYLGALFNDRQGAEKGNGINMLLQEML